MCGSYFDNSSIGVGGMMLKKDSFLVILESVSKHIVSHHYSIWVEKYKKWLKFALIMRLIHGILSLSFSGSLLFMIVYFFLL